MNWNNAFVDARCQLGAAPAVIDEFIESVCAPLTQTEMQELTEEHRRALGGGAFDPVFDPSIWKLPCRAFPATYLELLRHSNGGFFRGRYRDLDPLFSTFEVRDYMLAYSVPHWLPETLPFAFDGGGGFYLLDLRSPSTDDEYPIIWSHACNLSFEDARLLGPSFREFIETGLGPE
jgi:hypothetical protein